MVWIYLQWPNDFNSRPQTLFRCQETKKKLNSHVFWCFYHAKETKKNWKSHLTRFLLLFSYVTSNEESTIYGPWGLAQVVKGWGGFVGGSRFKSQWGQKNYLYIKKKCIYIYIHTIYEFQFPSPSYIFSLTNGASR